MRISDWSSDVCSSDLCEIGPIRAVQPPFRSRASRDDHHPVQPGHGVGQRHISPTGLSELVKLAGAAEFAKATAQVEGENPMPPRQPGLQPQPWLASQADPGDARAQRPPAQTPPPESLQQGPYVPTTAREYSRGPVTAPVRE